MNYRPKFLLYKENPSVPRDLLGQTFLYNLPYFIECGFYFLHCGTCVQGLSKIVVAAKMHALHRWKLLGLLYILHSYLQKGKSLEFISGDFQKDSNYTWTLTCGTNLSDFFPCGVFICHCSSFQPEEMEEYACNLGYSQDYMLQNVHIWRVWHINYAFSIPSALNCNSKAS